MTIDEIAAELAQLRGLKMKAAMAALSSTTETPNYDSLVPKQKSYVDEYVACFDRRKAADRAGYAPFQAAITQLKTKAIYMAINEKTAQRAETSALKAEYVREYIRDVLELCPTDHFVLAPDGLWMIAPEQFRELPQRVKRLVDSVEHRVSGGKLYVMIKFISKAAALAMAAKYTLVEHHEVEIKPTLPWDEIAGKLENLAKPSVEARLMELENRTNGAHT